MVWYRATTTVTPSAKVWSPKGDYLMASFGARHAVPGGALAGLEIARALIGCQGASALPDCDGKATSRRPEGPGCGGEISSALRHRSRFHTFPGCRALTAPTRHTNPRVPRGPKETIMRLRMPLIVLAAAAMFISGMLPAGAEADIVDRYNRLVATGNVTFTSEGRTKVSDIVGDEFVVDAVGTVIERIPFKAKAFDRPLAATMARVPCVHDNTREGFTPYTPPAQYPIDQKNEKGMFRFHFYSVDEARHNHLNQPTVQFLGCAAGGVDAENGSRITISGPGVAFNDPNTSYILGQIRSGGREGRRRTTRSPSASRFPSGGSTSPGRSSRTLATLSGAPSSRPTAAITWRISTRTASTPGGRTVAVPAAPGSVAATTTRARWARDSGSSPSGTRATS